ncbi:hypothetical protein CDD82_6858 [Ophiocordyceps australis]|uniref:J domain-containing protein n=1 Tax=Ophiocordyceps australis TaxID=1399860 RepID=A0A2C5YT36_9HYPO|nr:hypothetical protein CDD82_6858 [Ophiocordyceps australis]
MSQDNKDLVRLAGEYAEQNIDLYHLLAVDALTSKDDIHRAWRKRSLKYHPDKAGDSFDADKWTLFERARDILCDESARAVYDQAIKARLVRKQQRAAMDEQHRRYANDLEAGEQAASKLRHDKQQSQRQAMAKERERLAQDLRMRQDEKLRQDEAAQHAQDMAEARRRVQERKDDKARKRQVRQSIKTWAGPAANRTAAAGPPNGTVDVPGSYRIDLADGTGSRQYWQLVCDKLRAVQALRNLQKNGTLAQAVDEAETQAVDETETRVREAETRVFDTRRRIYEAEKMYAASAQQATT